MKKPLWIAAAAVALVAVLLIKDVIAAGIVRESASSMLGTDVKVEHLRIRIFTSEVHIGGFRVMQPKGFPRGALLDVDEAKIKYDLGSLLSGKLRVRHAEVRIREAVVIRDKNGALNVDALKVAKKDPEAQKSPSRLQVDSLTLTVERVVSKDLSKGDKPVVEVWNLPIHDKTYSRIASPSEMASLVFVEALQSAAIKGALIYGATAAAGAAFLPVGAVMLFSGGDKDMEIVRADFGRAYKASLEALGDLGNVTLDDKASGTLKGVVNGCEVTVILKKEGFRKVNITVQARKLLLPQPRIAAGVLYTILENLR